jgi:3-dehydroquinate synthetase
VITRVDLGDRGYDVVTANDYDGLRDFVRGRRRVAVVTQTAVERSCGEQIRASLDAAGTTYRVFEMGDREDAKTLATIELLTRDFTRWGLLRGDLVVAAGGGVVGDTAGFAAAVYLRGIDVVQVPTWARSTSPAPCS